ncbi:MAG TPA: chemotaxis protein CheB [Candidatus Limnocylindrales bacterium]|nr:chemotaxis protein CheB [Candidatus Limnocylindrales bacterium]
MRGCEALAAAGAQILVQDEASSVVWGMPGFVARAGLAEIVRRTNASPPSQLQSQSGALRVN